MGPPKLSYERIAPPNSFIHVQDFKTPTDLAKSVTIRSFFKTLSSIHNGNHFQVPVTLGLSSRGISEIPWSVKIIAINQFSLNSVQLGKVATRPNVLNLGAVNCAGRCRRCKDQRGDKFRASSICGQTVPAIQTGLTRRGATNEDPTGWSQRSYIKSQRWKTQSLMCKCLFDRCQSVFQALCICVTLDMTHGNVVVHILEPPCF